MDSAVPTGAARTRAGVQPVPAVMPALRLLVAAMRTARGFALTAPVKGALLPTVLLPTAVQEGAAQAISAPAGVTKAAIPGAPS
ncbi:hypothetical protein I6N91_16465 [Arthrobacter sp. MSA 4-2]|uniref:hypothetical protein n=1 Tax=Arthrobacter sp. MSA 4-2 TaxID=2794349 RepID=UPI0018E88BF0|nr:hypothetical protein [Arthrobacter sp. MSA 4-2]MBJ2122574.1 hypothetical protein [Arthrobacter sp. MSA 4-2]